MGCPDLPVIKFVFLPGHDDEMKKRIYWNFLIVRIKFETYLKFYKYFVLPGLEYRRAVYDSTDLDSHLELSCKDKIFIESKLKNIKKSRRDEMEI
jgi:hypothetical protein